MCPPLPEPQVRSSAMMNHALCPSRNRMRVPPKGWTRSTCCDRDVRLARAISRRVLIAKPSPCSSTDDEADRSC